VSCDRDFILDSGGEDEICVFLPKTVCDGGSNANIGTRDEYILNSDGHAQHRYECRIWRFKILEDRGRETDIDDV
jgi:hypothetical protein